jgi:hypothetical protein
VRAFDGVQVFSATKAHDRVLLGERVTSWLDTHRDLDIVNKTVVQSSDSAFHCLTIVLFWRRTQDCGA